MLGFLKRRAFLTLLGFLLIAIFIWFAGPLIAFADYVPLESTEARIAVFVLVVAAWAIAKLVKMLRAFRASDRLVAAVVRQAPAEERPSAEALQLRERFEDAVGTLKKSRRSGHSLYDLPWYIIIGAPGSGKTTALLNSGLKFPLEQRVGRGALRGVGGTRNCDWWFTDEAIFLDTAGRYTTQDSDTAADSAGWAEFLSLLRKYRKRRPLNGIILTISAQDLMVQGARGREAHVEAARHRLEEINKELHIQLPVYVMVTKCDLVAGFSEYFDDLSQEGRAQVWGVTFPYEQTLSGEAARTFAGEFEQLIARLNARVFARVEEDRDSRRRARIFAFPQQAAALRDSLAEFVGEVFSSTRLDQRILLRGVYLTSGTQEGTPIDRLLGAIGRRYGVTPEAVVPPTGRGKAYFVERLLKEVMIGESGLAGVNRRLEVQKAALQLAAYAGMALVAAVGFLALSVSFGRNRTYIAETAEALSKLESTPPVARTAAPEALLPRLEVLAAVADVANRYRGSAPWSMRWGLFQGTSIGNAARDAYVRELDTTLLPRVAARIEERLPQFAPEPEKLYEYLKAYLMLGEPRYLKKDHLRFVANLEWNAADNNDPATAAALSRHFQHLLDDAETLRPMAMNPARITQACSTIRQASIPQIIYSRLKRTYQEDSARAVRLDLAAGVGVDQVIRRRSGRPLSQPVPSFFSRAVFQEVASRQAPDLVKAFADEDWVCGGDSSTRLGSTRLADVTDLYERDYINVWDAILEDIELMPFGSAANAIEALGILSGPASPLRGLFAVIADNTYLLQQPDQQQESAVDAAKKAITSRLPGKGVTDKLGSLFGQTKNDKTRPPGVLVTAYFQQVHALMAGDQGNAPIDRIILRMGQVQHQLRALEGASGATILTDPELRELLRSLQEEAATMPPIIQTLAGQVGRRAELAAGANVTTTLDRRFREEVQQECAQLLQGRYPFDTESDRHLPLSDFATLFGYNGIFDKFFRENLEPLVDRSQSPWAWRSVAADASRGMLEQFERAHEIRELFFRRGSNALEIRFYLTVLESDTSSIRFLLESDGTGFEYKVPVRNAIGVWPGPTSGTAAVTWFGRYGTDARLAFLGPWALFKLLDAGQEQRESETRFVYVFQHQGHRSRVRLEAMSVLNPFSNRRWQQFRCQF
jgi:type VI secretion system protein ImpL